MIHHAGLLAKFLGGYWRGVLIEGESGAGKSDLALRALDAGWSLVADDRTLLWACEGKLYGRAPEVLSGMMEARGLGVSCGPARPFAAVSLIARCVGVQAIERYPEDETKELLGVSTPLVRLAALEASAPAKLARALSHLGVRL